MKLQDITIWFNDSGNLAKTFSDLQIKGLVQNYCNYLNLFNKLQQFYTKPSKYMYFSFWP